MTANSRFNPIDALRSLPLGKSQKSAELDLLAPTPGSYAVITGASSGIGKAIAEELARRWYPHVYNGQPAKGMAHRALADIKESIRELDYYRRAMLVETDPSNADATAAAKAATERFPI